MLNLDMLGSPSGGQGPVDPEDNDIGNDEPWWLRLLLRNYGKYDTCPLFVCSALAAQFGGQLSIIGYFA